MLAALNHPNIATIHGLEHADEISMLVMEYVEGQTISQRLAALGPWTFDQALPLFEQMAEALQDAHEAGIIHRDLKPDNIKVTPAGKVKILDFGLAKAYSSDTAVPFSQDSPTVEVSLTQSGVAVGTAIYMSPEQMAGLTLDGRSDLFQLGMVFCQMLTGR
ncbi:MAG: serine/threonine-protein kinase, partial [Acidobacteriota bacterium]